MYPTIDPGPFKLGLSLFRVIVNDCINQGNTMETLNKGHVGDNINSAILSFTL